MRMQEKCLSLFLSLVEKNSLLEVSDFYVLNIFESSRLKLYSESRDFFESSVYSNINPCF